MRRRSWVGIVVVAGVAACGRQNPGATDAMVDARMKSDAAADEGVYGDGSTQDEQPGDILGPGNDGPGSAADDADAPPVDATAD